MRAAPFVIGQRDENFGNADVIELLEILNSKPATMTVHYPDTVPSLSVKHWRRLMSRPLYTQGDTIVLRSGIFRQLVPIATCQIASVRSDFYGKTEYHVRFADEIFDRCVTEADIDQAASTAARV